MAITITFRIENGEVTEEVEGATPGTPECLAATAPYEKALSPEKPTDRDYKPEFSPNVARQTNTQKAKNTL